MPSIASRLEARDPRSIAATVARLISAGELAPGDRLPTVRDLAIELGVSPATVGQAWRALARAGLIVSRGRSGTFVRQTERAWMPARYRGLDSATEAAVDLSRGSPDPDLVPSLAGALSRLQHDAAVIRYQDKPDVPELHDWLRATWPAPVESLTVVNGALDAVDRVLASVLRFGDRVVVENPGFPPLVDLLEQYGAEPVGVALDAHGAVPASLAHALGTRPALVVLQPRAQNPTGASMTPARAEELAAVLARARGAEHTLVLEDDHSAPIASAEPVSLARWLPERVLHVRSFSKSHGPDLRIGALGGPRTLIDRIVARRLLGPGWTSRMTQRLLFDLVTDPVSIASVTRAADEYRARQTAFAAALARQGVAVRPGDGINAWVPVADERQAIVRLATAGVRVAPGTPFFVGAPQPFVRVTVGAVRDPGGALADAIASAARE